MPRPYFKSLTALAAAFFMMGFITCMNDILFQHLKSVFDLNWTKAALVQFAFFSAYFFCSIPAAKVCERFGFQRGIWGGLLICSVGAFGFLGASALRSYELFLVCLLVLASGITLIQVAANPLVALLGDPKTAPSRLTLVQAFNSVGTSIAPLIGASLILANTQVSSVQLPYLGMAVLALLLAVGLGLMRFPKVEAVQKTDVPLLSLLQNRSVALGALGIFAYVGAEVAIGSYLIAFLSSPFAGGIDVQNAGRYVSIYWTLTMVGRFVFPPVLARFDPARVLQVLAFFAFVFVVGAMGMGGIASQWSLLLVGFFNSIMFATIFSLTVGSVTHGAEKVSGILCTSVVGGAVVPLLQGHLADLFGVRASFVLPLLCYGYLVVFGALRSLQPMLARAGLTQEKPS